MARRLSDDDMERLLTGRMPSDPSWRVLAEALSFSADEMPPGLAAAHVAAAADAATAAARGVAAPTARRRRRLVARGALSGMVLKVLLGTAVAVAATGGAAATGLLPGPIQNAIADGAAHLGLHLPHATPATDLSPTTSAQPGETTTTLAGPTPFRWDATSCAGLPLAVEVSSASGTLTVGSITGDTDEIDARPDRIEVRFDDGVRVRIQLEDGVPVATEDRPCDHDEATGEDGTDDEAADEENSGEGSGSSGGDESDQEAPGDEDDSSSSSQSDDSEDSESDGDAED